MARFDTKPKQVRTRGGGGPKFVFLCDKVIIEFLLNGIFVTYIMLVNIISEYMSGFLISRIS